MIKSKIPFEAVVAEQFRRIRQSRNTDAPPELIGYITGRGETREMTGDDVGPYVHAIGRASDTGVSERTVANGEAQRVLTDEYGRIWTRTSSAPAPAADAAQNRHSSSLVSKMSVLASESGQPGYLYEIRAIVDAAVVEDRFVQVFDLSSFSDIEDGIEPIWEALISASNTTSSQYAEAGDDFAASGGLFCENGIMVALSTTPGVLTLPALNAQEAYFMATYRAV